MTAQPTVTHPPTPTPRRRRRRIAIIIAAVVGVVVVGMTVWMLLLQPRSETQAQSVPDPESLVPEGETLVSSTDLGTDPDQFNYVEIRTTKSVCIVQTSSDGHTSACSPVERADKEPFWAGFGDPTQVAILFDGEFAGSTYTTDAEPTLATSTFLLFTDTRPTVTFTSPSGKTFTVTTS